MKDNVAAKPNREPDVILPATETFHEIHLWVSEKVFGINTDRSDGLNYRSSLGSELFEEKCKEPMAYLEVTSKMLDKRGLVARNYLELFDKILIGETDE